MSIASKVEQWLNSPSIDHTTKAEIKQYSEKELNDAFYTNLEFGTGGLRGIMGAGTNRMNKYVVGMATQGLANYLKTQFPDQSISVAIAHDSRNNSSFFAATAAAVFSANDITVYLFSALRPTPELSFAIRHLGCQSGVVITASHNPKEYNGYKAYWNDGGQLIPPHDHGVIEEVRKITAFDQVRFEGNESLIKRIDQEVDQAYLTSLQHLSLLDSAPEDVKIVFSSIHGTGITLVPEILDRFGFKNVTVVQEQAQADGNFPTVVYPNPEEKEAMQIALNKAIELDADLVMATDPDADRVGIGVKNNHGDFQLLNGNQTGALLIYYLLSKYADKGLKGNEFIAKTIVTSDLLTEIADGFGVTTYETLTGFKYIAQVIREKEGQEVFIGGGEESYGYLIGDAVRDKDAVASCAMIAEMVAWAKAQGKSVFDVLLEIYVKFGFYKERLHSITRKGQSGAQEITDMMVKFGENPPEVLGDSKVRFIIDYKNSTKKDLSDDNISKVDLPSSNVLQFITEDGSKVSVRPSGTEPKIKFYCSAKTKLGSAQDFDLIYQKIEEKLDTMLKDLLN